MNLSRPSKLHAETNRNGDEQQTLAMPQRCIMRKRDHAAQLVSLLRPTRAAYHGCLNTSQEGKSTWKSNTSSRFRPSSPGGIDCDFRNLSLYQPAVYPGQLRGVGGGLPGCPRRLRLD